MATRMRAAAPPPENFVPARYVSRTPAAKFHIESSGLENEALVSAANMMMQTERAQRATTRARMDADTKTQEALASATKNIEQLTRLVTRLSAQVAKLTEERRQQTLVQDAIIADLQRRYTETAAKVEDLIKLGEFLKIPARHYYALSPKHWDNNGNRLDEISQMVDPKPPPSNFKSTNWRHRRRPPSDFERAIDYDKPELWQVGYVKPTTFGIE